MVPGEVSQTERISGSPQKPAAHMTADVGTWVGLEAKVAKSSHTYKRTTQAALVISSGANRETTCTAAGTDGVQEMH